MSDCNEAVNQTDEEMILRDEVSDKALEAASVAPGGFPTLVYGTYCFTCPSAKLLSKDEAANCNGYANSGGPTPILTRWL